MPETVSDILGKDLAFEQRVQIDTITEAINGTIAAFVGGANWGPLNTPKSINKNFTKQFGYPITRDDNADVSALAMEYHLRFSPLAWFIRVDNGKSKKSERAIVKPATVGKYVGNYVANKTFIITEAGKNLTLKLNGGIAKTIALPVTPKATAIAGIAVTVSKDELKDSTSSFNYAVGDYIDFVIDGTSYRYIVDAKAGANFTTLCDPTVLEADTYASRWIAAAANCIPSLPVGAFTKTTNGDGSETISINSDAQGANSNIRINSIPKVFAATPDAPKQSSASNTSITAILQVINADTSFTDVDGAVAYINSDGYLIIETKKAGSAKSVEVTVIPAGLGSVGVGVIGTATELNGTFKAVYTGSDGDTIQIIKSTDSDSKMLEVYFRDSLVQRFLNYSCNVADTNFFGTLINDDTDCAEVVKFIVPDGATVVPDLADGTYTLAGGDSGTYDPQTLTSIPDSAYTHALDQYTNEDLYRFEILCVSGVSSVSVYNKLKEVCETRQDCFFHFDMPDDVGGLGSTYTRAIQWHNGSLDSFKQKIDSRFAVLSYPHMLITASNAKTNAKQWVPSSVRYIGVLSNSDNIAQTTTAAPAGPKRGVITDVEGLAYYLQKKEKVRLYADELGNAINPIVFNSNKGFYVDGQKNADRTFGPLSRINNIRTAIGIKKFIDTIADDFFWEPVTKDLRDELFSVVEKHMEALVKHNAVKKGYTIICDSTINTETVEAKRGMILMVEWEGIDCLEKMKVISVAKGKRVITTYA